MEHLGLFYGPQYKARGEAIGMGPTYQGWDADSVTMCNCDPGYFGADCSRSKCNSCRSQKEGLTDLHAFPLHPTPPIEMCPKGDDPVTVGQQSRGIQVALKSTDGLAMKGVLRLTFELFTTEMSISGSITE